MPKRTTYTPRLLSESAQRPLTATRIAELIGSNHGPSAVNRLRSRKDLRVIVIGQLPDSREKLYRVVQVSPVSGPYCCGWCERERQRNNGS